jgi:hypothetical protein
MQVRRAILEAAASQLVASGIPADRVFIDQRPKPWISWAQLVHEKRLARRRELYRLRKGKK